MVVGYHHFRKHPYSCSSWLEFLSLAKWCFSFHNMKTFIPRAAGMMDQVRGTWKIRWVGWRFPLLGAIPSLKLTASLHLTNWCLEDYFFYFGKADFSSAMFCFWELIKDVKCFDFQEDSQVAHQCLDWNALCHHVLVFIWTKATFSEAKDEAGNDYNDILLMLQKSQTTTWDAAKTLVNNGINYQPQLVNAGVSWILADTFRKIGSRRRPRGPKIST